MLIVTCKPFMLNVVMLSVVMLSVVMLSVIMPSVDMLSGDMLSGDVLSVIMLSVVAPKSLMILFNLMLSTKTKKFQGPVSLSQSWKKTSRQ
jgi:hypothetical protein